MHDSAALASPLADIGTSVVVESLPRGNKPTAGPRRFIATPHRLQVSPYWGMKSSFASLSFPASSETASLMLRVRLEVRLQRNHEPSLADVSVPPGGRPRQAIAGDHVLE